MGVFFKGAKTGDKLWPPPVFWGQGGDKNNMKYIFNIENMQSFPCTLDRKFYRNISNKFKKFSGKISNFTDIKQSLVSELVAATDLAATTFKK